MKPTPRWAALQNAHFPTREETWDLNQKVAETGDSLAENIYRQVINGLSSILLLSFTFPISQLELDESLRSHPWCSAVTQFEIKKR